VLASHMRNKIKNILLLTLLSITIFTPFIVSTDGLLGCEADAVIFKLAGKYAKKLTKLIQWFVALYAIALPFFMPLVAVFEVPIFSLLVV